MESVNARVVASTVAPAAVLTAAVGSDVSDLKKAILTRWGQSEKELGPLFSKLRSKLKASGKKGTGFGTWLDAHRIPRSTADRWANNYEIGIGSRPAKAKALKLTTTHAPQSSTFPQVKKGASDAEVVDTVDTGEYIERIMLSFLERETRGVFEGRTEVALGLWHGERHGHRVRRRHGTLGTLRSHACDSDGSDGGVPVKTVHLQTQLPDATVEKLQGQYLDTPDYDGQPVAEDAVVYKPNGEVLFKLVRNALPLDLCNSAWEALRSVSADASHRVVASGKASPRQNGVSDVVGFLESHGTAWAGLLPVDRLEHGEILSDSHRRFPSFSRLTGFSKSTCPIDARRRWRRCGRQIQPSSSTGPPSRP